MNYFCTFAPRNIINLGMNKYIIAFVLCCYITSCIKDEAQNNECDIESAWIEGAEFEKNFYQVTDMRKDNISSTETNISFLVRPLFLVPLSTQIPMHFKITPGATIEPANGSPQDFTKGPIIYTVTSEDGQWKRFYNVSIQESPLPMQKFSFENVETHEVGARTQMHIFYEMAPASEGGSETAQPKYCWASGNAGAAILKTDSKPEDLPTYQSPDGYVGNCACLNTQSTGAFGELFKKPIAAGNLFLGEFVIEHVTGDALRATQFGVPNPMEPVRITGWYKYKPGEQFTDKDMKVHTDRKDEGSIYAVYYRNQDAEGNKYMLDGHAVEYLDKLMDNPQVYKVARVASLPPTDTWTRWEMIFEGKDAPNDIVQAQGFNLALVFSSSKDGAQFEGAIGSTLYIDEVEVSYEK